MCNDPSQFRSGSNDRGADLLPLSSMKTRFCQWILMHAGNRNSPDEALSILHGQSILIGT